MDINLFISCECTEDFELPTIAQLVERPTVDDSMVIGRSLVRIRVVGAFFVLWNCMEEIVVKF